jgi:hypothetical protein
MQAIRFRVFFSPRHAVSSSVLNRSGAYFIRVSFLKNGNKY